MLATPAAIKQSRPAMRSQIVWRGGRSRRIPRMGTPGGAEVTSPEIARGVGRSARNGGGLELLVSSEAAAPNPAGRSLPPALLALVAPDAGMDRQARVGTARVAFLVAFACAVLAAFAQAYRVDSREATLKKLEQGGQLQTMSDRQFDDETRNANRLYQVMRIGQGVFEAPVFLGLGSLAVVGLVWFLRGKAKGLGGGPAAAAARPAGTLPHR